MKRTILVFMLAVLVCGCIRLSGGAGYSTVTDEGVETKSASFDTARLYD